MRTTTESEFINPGILATQLLKQSLTNNYDVDTWGEFQNDIEISEAEPAEQVYKTALVALGRRKQSDKYSSPNNNTWTVTINNSLDNKTSRSYDYDENSRILNTFTAHKTDNSVCDDDLPVIYTVEALAFADKEGLDDYLTRAITIIKQSFSKLHEIEIIHELDPEANESWISLNTTIEGEIEQIFNEYENYTDKVNKEIPWPQIGLIRFSYNII